LLHSGEKVVTVDIGGLLLVHDCRTGASASAHEMRCEGMAELVTDLEGKLIACADDAGVVHVWDAETGRPVQEYQGHRRGSINVLALNRNAGIALTGLRDDVVLTIWRLVDAEV